MFCKLLHAAAASSSSLLRHQLRSSPPPPYSATRSDLHRRPLTPPPDLHRRPLTPPPGPIFTAAPLLRHQVRSSPLPPGWIIMDLNCDLVYQILLRLSVKILIRVQCVCKQWCSIITDPSFRRDHYLLRSQQDPLLLLSRHEFGEARTDSDTNNSTLHLSIYNTKGNLITKISRTGNYPPCPHYTVQSCHGLLCIVPTMENQRHRLLLCNPSTTELMVLPPGRESRISIIGLGYGVSTKEFKVVRLFCSLRSGGGEEFLCEIFVPGTGGWRQARSPPQYKYISTSGLPFIHGALHLLREPLHHDVDSFINGGILAFDIESEEYRKIRIPEYYRSAAASSIKDLYLQELGGSLCLTFDFKNRMELWCLKEYHARKWVKEYTIDFHLLGSEIWADPLSIMGDGRMLLSIAKDDKSGQSLHYYNPSDKSVQQITEEDGYTTIFVESFMSLGGSV